MNLLNVNFQELYRRHLCRHSEFGINVLHLVAVAGIYLALYGIAFALPGAPWIVGSVLAIYLIILALNIPVRLWIVNALAIFLLLTLFLSLPTVPVWVHIGLIFVWHRFQNWNHKVFHKEHDMQEFSDKYKKGPVLFLLLAVYELPILLNYLMFDRRSHAATTPGL